MLATEHNRYRPGSFVYRVSGLAFVDYRRAPGQPRTIRASAYADYLLRGGRHRVDGVRRDRRGRQAGQDLLRHQPDPLGGFGVSEEARAADKDEMGKAADLVVDVHDLPVDRVGV